MLAHAPHARLSRLLSFPRSHQPSYRGRRMRRLGFTVLLLGLAACKFAPPPDVLETDAAGGPVGGQVSGLWTGASLGLRLTAPGYADQTLTVTQEGAFTFPTAFPNGTAFTLSIDTQPAEHTCTIPTASGEVNGPTNTAVVTCTSSIVVAVSFLSAVDFVFDPQVSVQPTVNLSVLQSEARLFVDGPAGSSAQLNSIPLGYQTPVSMSLDLGLNTLRVDFAVGALSRRYAVPIERGAVGAVQSYYGKPTVRDAGDYFGGAVAGSGARIIVGATWEASSSQDPQNDDAVEPGAVYVFRRNGAVWTQEAYLKGSDISSYRRFGTSVDIDEDTAVVGSDGMGAWVFRRSGPTWMEEARLLRAVDWRSANGNAGEAVAIDHDLVAVSQTYDLGAVARGVHLFRGTGSTWTPEAVLTAPASEAADGFGYSLALSGDLLAVGAPQEDSSATGVSSAPAADDDAVDSGAVYLFRRTGGSWALEAYIKASNAGAGDGFGYSVSVYQDVLIVGAPTEQSGNGLPSDNSTADAGAVYVFRRSESGWRQEAYVKAPNPGEYKNLGGSVSAGRDVFATSSGVFARGYSPELEGVQVFERRAGAWRHSTTIATGSGEHTDRLGAAIDLFDEGLVIGAPNEDGDPGPADNNAQDSGASYVFR